MINIVIEGKQGEGKTILVGIISKSLAANMISHKINDDGEKLTVNCRQGIEIIPTTVKISTRIKG